MITAGRNVPHQAVLFWSYWVWEDRTSCWAFLEVMTSVDKIIILGSYTFPIPGKQDRAATQVQWLKYGKTERGRVMNFNCLTMQRYVLGNFEIMF